MQLTLKDALWNETKFNVNIYLIKLIIMLVHINKDYFGRLTKSKFS